MALPKTFRYIPKESLKPEPDWPSRAKVLCLLERLFGTGPSLQPKRVGRCTPGARHSTEEEVKEYVFGV